MNTATLEPSANPATAHPMSEQALGRIAVQLPGATAVFRRLKLDFCCGGQISLRQAALDKGLDLDALLRELGSLQRDDTPTAPVQASALIDHILERFHAVHREQLPELIRMARRVEAVHREHPAAPAGLAAHLEHMEQELLDHMAKEENVLFPMLKAGGNPFVPQPIAMMRHEHVAHGAELARMLALAHDMVPPPGACNTWQALYAGLQQFHDDLIQHIHLENNLLFPQFEQALAQAAGACEGACACA
jgi:regulator of cell morphogenesis and NO signaling